jgi:hypothetical protein
VFCSAKCLRFPINPFVAEEESDKEYPQKYHWKVTTADDPTHAQMRESADFRRAKPEYRNPSPGTIIITIAEQTMMNPTSPCVNHWLRFSVPVVPPASECNSIIAHSEL